MVKVMKSTLCYKNFAERPNKLNRNSRKNGLICQGPGVNKKER